MNQTHAEGSVRRNSEAPWDSFDSLAYLEHNYRTLRDDDRQILLAVREYFARHFREHPGPPVPGIDVGAGTNLYPALAMLPWCSEITLLERSAGNVAWLEQQTADYAPNWDAFWQLLAEDPAYADAVPDPRSRLRRLARVEKGDLFNLAAGRWGIGTMFFVAESLSTAPDEFETAVGRFLGALTPGAPFAAAFMENSKGYDVGTLRFPACPVNEADVRACLVEKAAEVSVRRIEIPGEPLREGYTGMLLAWGRTR
jgi:hypothetical protein